MNATNHTSKRRARLKAHFPSVTLAQAMTRLAFGKAFDSAVLLRFRHRNKGHISLVANEALDTVGRRLAVLALDGKLILRGERQSNKASPLEEAANIPCEIFGDGVHFEPSLDVIEMDLLLDRHFADGGYPRYRHVRLDGRQLDLVCPTKSQSQGLASAVSPKILRRVGTPDDAKEFRKWADEMVDRLGEGPSRDEAEQFAMDRNVGRGWGRVERTKLPAPYLRKRGVARRPRS